jgi:tetratricopeptide (TPR) repeat protein
MMHRFVISLLALLALAAHAKAEEVATPTQAEALGWLMQDRFVELDARYGAIQQAYRDHRISDVELRAAFRVFYATDADLDAHYAAWVAQSPRSYVAHLARGIYYKKVGAERRGVGFIDQITPAQIEGMEAANKVAAQEFTASLALDDKPILTYLHSIDLDMDSGNKTQARQWLDRAIAIDPDDFVVRVKYMGALQTRWLGSVEEMKAFLAECRKANLPAAQIKTLEAIELDDEAWVHQYRDGNLEAAVRDYAKVAKLDPAASCIPCGPISKMADLLMTEKKYSQAIKQFSRVLAFNPNDVHSLDGRGYAELQVGWPLEAVADLVHAGNLGDAYAQDMLGRMYLLGTSVPADRDKALVWLQKAASQGYAPAQELLPAALDRNRTPLPVPGGPKL